MMILDQHLPFKHIFFYTSIYPEILHVSKYPKVYKNLKCELSSYMITAYQITVIVIKLDKVHAKKTVFYIVLP